MTLSIELLDSNFNCYTNQRTGYGKDVIVLHLDSILHDTHIFGVADEHGLIESP